jgi:hypothetical protein
MSSAGMSFTRVRWRVSCAEGGGGYEYGERDRQTDRDRDRERQRERERQAERQTQRQTQRQRQTEIG